MKSLVHLNLSNAYLHSSTGSVLGTFLAKDRILRTLNLCDNRLGAGASHIARALTSNQTLTHLDLKHNQIPIASLAFVANVVCDRGKNRTIRYLDVSGNYGSGTAEFCEIQSRLRAELKSRRNESPSHHLSEECVFHEPHEMPPSSSSCSTSLDESKTSITKEEDALAPEKPASLIVGKKRDLVSTASLCSGNAAVKSYHSIKSIRGFDAKGRRVRTVCTRRRRHKNDFKTMCVKTPASRTVVTESEMEERRRPKSAACKPRSRSSTAQRRAEIYALNAIMKAWADRQADAWVKSKGLLEKPAGEAGVNTECAVGGCW
eukprot:g340.t1